MSQPTPYTPTTDFSQQEANNASGRSTVNTASLDAEFAAIESTLDQTLANIQLIQRDDGKLSDLVVDIHTLTPEVLNLIGGFELKGDWSSATQYVVDDLVINGDYQYVCQENHTSGISFNSAYWKKFGFTAGSDAAQAAANAQASENSAAVSEANALEHKNAAQASAMASASSATSASSSATSASSSAASASVSATSAANSAAAAAANSIEAVIGGFKNKITNGDFLFDQENAGVAVTITAGSALKYVADQWYAYCTGANITGQQVQQVDNSYRYVITGAASNTGVGFGQRIEQADTANLAGGTATLQALLSSSSITTVTWTAYYANTKDSFGTLSSPTRTQIATGNFTINSTEDKYSAQISVPSDAKTGIEIVFTTGSLTSGNTIKIGNVQLEAGSVPTKFENIPIQYGLARCQRYWHAMEGIGICGYAAGGNSVMTTYVFPVTMRAVPTVAFTSLGTQSNSTGALFYGTSKTATAPGINASVSGTAYIYGATATANARM